MTRVGFERPTPSSFIVEQSYDGKTWEVAPEPYGERYRTASPQLALEVLLEAARRGKAPRYRSRRGSQTFELDKDRIRFIRDAGRDARAHAMAVTEHVWWKRWLVPVSGPVPSDLMEELKALRDEVDDWYPDVSNGRGAAERLDEIIRRYS